MAPRKKNRSRRRKFTGINITDAALGYAGVSIWSEALLGVGPIQFFTDTTGGSGTWELTGRELINSLMGGTGGVYGPSATAMGVEANALGVIKHNAMENAGGALFQSIALTAGGVIGKRVTRKPRNFLNRQLKNFGLGDMIRF